MAVVCISVYLIALVTAVNGASVGMSIIDMTIIYYNVSASSCVYIGVSYYRIPIPNLFNNSTDMGTGCGPAAGTNSLDCGMNTGLLVDGDTGPLHSLSSTNLHRFLAWNRTQTQPVTLSFRFEPGISSLSRTSVVLYFFNYPTQRIGLPSVTLWGSFSSTGNSPFALPYFYANNGNLMNSDSQLRNVSLRIFTNQYAFTNFLFIELVFTDIDWILLSEVDICQGISKVLIIKNSITVNSIRFH